MENEAYDFIQDLDTVKDFWKLKVRILSLSRSTFQLDFIVMDERGDKIHATVKKVLIPLFENVLQEGAVVMLSKFGVGANSCIYPVLRHRYKLNFYCCTSVKRVVGFNGPMYGFDFLPFSDVFHHLGDQNLPVVMGIDKQCVVDLIENVSAKVNQEMEKMEKVESILALINGCFDESKVLINQLEKTSFTGDMDDAKCAFREILAFEESYLYAFKDLVFSFELSIRKKHNPS